MTHEITIEAIDGPPLRTTIHNGQRYVGGELGQRYQIRITDPSSRTYRRTKFLAVTTVDGKNVIDGTPGSRAGAGMVATGECVIDGWRTDLDEVRAFRICQGAESYAVLDGSIANIGVIGVALFREREVLRGGAMRGRSMAEAVPASARGATRSAGTAMGERVTSRVSTTEFKREAESFFELEIRYDTTAALIEAGIMPSTTGPSAFPADVKAHPAFCRVVG